MWPSLPRLKAFNSCERSWVYFTLDIVQLCHLKGYCSDEATTDPSSTKFNVILRILLAPSPYFPSPWGWKTLIVEITFCQCFWLCLTLTCLSWLSNTFVTNSAHLSDYTGWFFWLFRPKKWLRVRLLCKSHQKSSKCQIFQWVWHLVIFRAEQ